MIPYTDFGPALRSLPDGSLVLEMSSHVRSADTSKLEARYPWVDAVDRKLFLLGWDAGAQWVSASGTPKKIHALIEHFSPP